MPTSLARQRLVFRCPSPIALLTLALWPLARPLAAQDAPPQDKSIVAAANAFTQAQRAELGGEPARAAELFELADRIAPTPEALRSATRARASAGQLGSAAGHAEELLERYPSDPVSRELAEQVLARARPELARYRVQCEAPCTVVVDGLATALEPAPSHIVYLSPGTHDALVGFSDGRERSLRLAGGKGESLSVKVQPPDPSAQPRQHAAQPGGEARASASEGTQGRSDAWGWPVVRSPYFWTAASLTVAAGALTLWSGIDLLEARDDFESTEQPTRAQFERGERKELRTNVLLGVTGAFAVSTAVLALFTDFRGDARTSGRSAHLSVAPGRAELLLRGAF